MKKEKQVSNEYVFLVHFRIVYAFFRFNGENRKLAKAKKYIVRWMVLRPASDRPKMKNKSLRSSRSDESFTNNYKTNNKKQQQQQNNGKSQNWNESEIERKKKCESVLIGLE